MMKPSRGSYVSDVARVVPRLVAMLVVSALLGQAFAQEPTAVASPRTAEPRMQPRTPATIPHTQPASRPQAGPQRGNLPKPTVVLKEGEVPAITFDQSTWDFGRVKAGEDLTHDFTFKNTGTGPLEILDVRPG
jgi:hypothetical protein